MAEDIYDGSSSGGGSARGISKNIIDVPNGIIKDPSGVISSEPVKPGYSISDDGTVRPYPVKFPDDFNDYIRGINDWQMDPSRKEPPSYEEWKKAQDPEWEPEDESIELPEELREAIEQAAQESGVEPPYKILIREEDNPELFHKIQEMFEEQQKEDPEVGFEPWLMGPDGDNPDVKLPDGLVPGAVNPNDPVASPYRPDLMSDTRSLEPSASPYILPVTREQLPDGVKIPLEGFDLPGDHIEIEPVTVITSGTNPEFFDALNAKVAEMDLDEVFSRGGLEDSISVDAEADREDGGNGYGPDHSPSREIDTQESEYEAEAEESQYDGCEF